MSGGGGIRYLQSYSVPLASDDSSGTDAYEYFVVKQDWFRQRTRETQRLLLAHLKPECVARYSQRIYSFWEPWELEDLALDDRRLTNNLAWVLDSSRTEEKGVRVPIEI